jgi:hypothetical protein
MLPPTGKSSDDLDKIAALIDKLGSSHQNYVAARTAIRDYLISVDEKSYAQVEQHLALAMEGLGQAESVADTDEAREIIHQLLTSVRDWSVIARQVRDAFATYQETVQTKILANFSALSKAGNELVRLNALLMTGVLLDLQSAHAAVTSYLNNGQDKLLASAQSAMSSAKTRINQAERSDENLRATLQSFSVSLDTYAEGLRKAVAHREKAYKLFHNDLAPLGVRTQSDIEHFRQQTIDRQRRT